VFTLVGVLIKWLYEMRGAAMKIPDVCFCLECGTTITDGTRMSGLTYELDRYTTVTKPKADVEFTS